MQGQPATPTHGDAGLQPERSDLAWRRTAMSLVVAASIFLRWMPHHGWFAGTLVAAAVATAGAINLSRKHRYLRAITGINREHIAPNAASTASLAASVVVLAALSIYTVLVVPLDR